MTVRTSDAMSYPLTLCMLQIVTCNCFYDYDITQNTTEDLRARTKYVTYCAVAVLVTSEFSTSRCTGHENIVLVDHEIREVQIYHRH